MSELNENKKNPHYHSKKGTPVYEQPVHGSHAKPKAEKEDPRTSKKGTPVYDQPVHGSHAKKK